MTEGVAAAEAMPIPAPSAPKMRALEFRFVGQTGEYYRLWIVNMLLTAATLGIYAAWAKVRTKRYLLGCTHLDGSPFEYHASPWVVLRGRLVLLAFLVGYGVLSLYQPVATTFIPLVILLAVPWIIRAALRFNARNTSWRNVRFDFEGTVWGAARAYLLWPLAAALTGALLTPYAMRAVLHYNIKNLRYGEGRLSCSMPVGPLYSVYMLNFFCWVVTLGLAVAVGALVPDDGESSLWHLAPLAVILLGAVMFSYFSLLLHGVALENVTSTTRLDGVHAVKPGFTGGRYAWALLVTGVATIVTFGLAVPWCQMRLRRALINGGALAVRGDMPVYSDRGLAAGSATGDVFATYEGLDLGVA